MQEKIKRTSNPLPTRGRARTGVTIIYKNKRYGTRRHVDIAVKRKTS